MTRARSLALGLALACLNVAVGAQGQTGPSAANARCAGCGHRESADTYVRAAGRVAGVWRSYFTAMAAYEGCMADRLSADAGRCADPPRSPAESPCDAPVGRGIPLCNATLPPDRPDAEFVALPEGLASVDLRQSAVISAGAVRYVWDALRAREVLAPTARRDDLAAVRVRRHETDSLLSWIAGAARPAPFEEPAYHAALDAGIIRLNHAAVTDDADEYVDALRLVALADSLHPSPNAKFVMGLLSYQIADHALFAAWQIHNCTVVLLAADAIMRADRYLGENSIVAPQNAILLRESLAVMREDARTLVTRRCL